MIVSKKKKKKKKRIEKFPLQTSKPFHGCHVAGKNMKLIAISALPIVPFCVLTSVVGLKLIFAGD